MVGGLAIANGNTRRGGCVATFPPEGLGQATTRIRSSTIADDGADEGGNNVYTEPSEGDVTSLSHARLAGARRG